MAAFSSLCRSRSSLSCSSSASRCSRIACSSASPSDWGAPAAAAPARPGPGPASAPVPEPCPWPASAAPSPCRALPLLRRGWGRADDRAVLERVSVERVVVTVAGPDQSGEQVVEPREVICAEHLGPQPGQRPEPGRVAHAVVAARPGTRSAPREITADAPAPAPQASALGPVGAGSPRPRRRRSRGG